MKSYGIYVDLAGYLPQSKRKLAALTSPAHCFTLEDAEGKVRFEGTVREFGFDECSGDNVFLADFSEFCEEGEFLVRADNGERSPLFRIADDVYDKVFDDTVKAFYFLRCGCGLEEKYAGKFRHGKCHTAPAHLWNDDSLSLDLTGGWHDAGDYGRYVTPGACAVAHLLYAYIMFPKSFDVQNLNIPKSGGKLPDILAECRVELDWIMKMQREDGGVFHKLTTVHHAPFVMPEKDTAQMYATPVSSSATADLAAVCALASRVYRSFDAEYADRLLSSAELSAQWLLSNPAYLFINPRECTTGAYGERDDKDNRFWAWAELFCATGNEQYHYAMKYALERDNFPLDGFGCGCVSGLGALGYVLSDREKDSGVFERLKAALVDSANYFAEMADGCGYGAAMDENSYGWGSTMNLTKRGMLFAIAHRLTGEERFADYAEQQLHVLLGHNALGFSFVSGTGENCMKNPHLRPTAADGIDECIPGFVSGGANRWPADDDARRVIKEGTPPMKCYADIVGAYSLNEVAIYWNSPVVFLLAFLLR